MVTQNSIDTNIPIDVDMGGTGQSTYTNGQLLIGNTTGNTLTKASLTGGTGITITPGAGSISIAADNNGDVVGPASATNTAVVRYNGTTGKLVQDSSVLIDASDNITGVTSLNIDGTTGATLVVDTDVLYVDSTNTQVGIGTASPDSILNIYQDNTDIVGETSLGLTIEQDGTGDAVLQFLITGEKRWIMGIDNSLTNDPLIFRDNTNNATFITMDGIAECFQVNDSSTDAYIGLDSPTGSPLTGRIVGNSNTNTRYLFIEFVLGTGGSFTEGSHVFFNTSGILRMILDDAGLYIKPASSSTFPTSYLHLGIGTATASTAPLKFTTGTNLTSPEDGAIEYDGTYLYSTDSTPIRRIIDSYLFTEVTGTSSSMVPNSVYTANNAGLVTFTLPTVISKGDVIQVSGNGAGGWKIAQNASQVIHSATSTTVGTGGSIASTARYDCVTLRCITDNTSFVIEKVVGTLTIV